MMKKACVFIALFFCSFAIFAQTPRFTTERMADGTLGIIVPSEQDALWLLNGNFNLPNTFIIAVLLRGLYLEEETFFNLGYLLRGTRLVNPREHGYQNGLGGLVRNFYNLNRNTEYYVIWRVELVHPGTILESRSSIVVSITDRNFNPLTPTRR